MSSESEMLPPESSIMFPLFDLANHGERRNIKCVFTDELQGLVVTATRRISPGEEVLLSYFDRNEMSAWTNLRYWGFISPEVAPEVTLEIGWIQQESVQDTFVGRRGDVRDVQFKLSMDTTTTDAKSFLSYLRILAVGGPTEVEAGGPVEYVAPSTWAVERLALQMGSAILRDALASYNDTEVDRFEAAQRIEYLMILCQRQKLALNWWLEVLQRGLDRARWREGRADLTYLDDPWHAQLYRAVLPFLTYIYSQAQDAWAEHPFELLVFACGCATARHGIVMLVRFGIRSCCRHSRTSIVGTFDKFCSLSNRWNWLGSMVALASAASMQRSDVDIQFVLIATVIFDLYYFYSEWLVLLLSCSFVALSIYLATGLAAGDVVVIGEQ
eukprot:TRINITY_DN8888_c0_g1_i9.p1 TRINITY_DN8888_c0_g1~~TRINITY_DN8888_c0_g1_i9.p1  ORF type:complete len:449 (-),score=53.46 TRINITY_DN8888_c0_g1_i9:163-1317(-)